MIFDYFHDILFEDKEGPKSIYSIAVTVYEVNHVAWENLETRVCVQLGKTKKYTKVKESSERPYYNEYFSFDYEGSLEKMMDMILIIAVQNYRPGLKRHRLLGSARLDLGAIWTQPGHGISDKWILLTHPSDPSGHIRGYINCEIAILPSGEKPAIRRLSEPTDYFIPESQGGGRLKARYIFRIHRGVDMHETDKKGNKIFVRVMFAGLSGETTKRKHNTFPVWKEEIVFTELFPPMYNRLRIDVHFGKNRVSTKFLDLSKISDPALKGYLPTYGPSFIHLYKPPYKYLGALLVSLETLTVQAFSESEKLLGVKRQHTQELIEKFFWNIEDFALFGVIYEVSMFQIPKIKQQQAGIGEFQISLGFGSNRQMPFSEGNRYSSLPSTPVFMNGSYWCFPETETKPTLFARMKLPDNRHRLFLSNRLLHIAKEFGEDIAKLQFQVEHSSVTSKTSSIEGVLARLINNCFMFKASAKHGPTQLDKERFRSIIKKMNKVIKDINEIKHTHDLKAQYEKCVEVYKFITDFSIGQQESFPWVILTLEKDSKVLAYARIHTRNILFSSKENEKGLYCGKIQTFFLKNQTKDEEEDFAGKIDILLWFGPFLSVGYGIEEIPRGYRDITQLTHFPEALRYTEGTYFMCRVHLYQGHFLPCDYATGTCSLYVTIHFDCKSASSSVKDVLSPIWMETLIIKNVLIYGDHNSVEQNPPRIILEVWNSDGRDKSLLGRHVYTPKVFFGTEYLQNPPLPSWYKISYKKHNRGEILAMFEMIKDYETASYSGDYLVTEITEIPDYIKFRTSTYRMEVLLWGIRGSFSLPISSLNNPRIIVNCGPIQLTSNSIKNPSAFPNFNQPVFITDLELPDNWLFSPPFVVRLYDKRSFGTQVFIGSHVVRNLKQFVRILPKKKHDLTVLRESIRLNFENKEIMKKRLKMLYEESLKDMEKPLIELKYDVDVKNLNIFSEITGKLSKWYKRICFCFYSKKKEEDIGYISLGLVGPVNDPDTEEQFFDWWTKYFYSNSLNSSEKKDNVTDKIKIGEGDFFHRGKTAGISFYTTELEKIPEFEGFEDLLSTFRLTKPSWKRQNDAGKFKGSVALYQRSPDDVTMEGHSVDEGLFSGIAKELGAVVPLVIRVYIIRAHRLAETEKIRTVNPFVEIHLSYSKFQLSDAKNHIKNEINPVFGRCYEIKTTLPYDSTLTVRFRNKTGCKCSELIGETHIDIENRYYSRHRGTCGLQRVYSVEGYNTWRDTEKPTEILIWKCMSHNLPYPEYDIDLNYVTLGGQIFGIEYPYLINDNPDIRKENLALSALLNWHKIPVSGCKLLEEHVETRSLYSPLQPGIEKGRVEMWVDLFSGNSLIPPAVNITPRIPEKYELRAVVWTTHNIKLTDTGSAVGKKNTDIFVKGWLRGKEDLQRTDVHYASMTGEGSFNWRFIFRFSYDSQEKVMLLDDLSHKQPPILNLQVWDSERLGRNRFLGALSLDLRDLASPSKRFLLSKKYLPIKGWKRNLFKERFVRGSWPFIQVRKDGKKENAGMIDLELALLTSLEAERSPAGHGRNDPDALPPPLRPVVHYTMWIVPFRAIKRYLWTYHKGVILKGLFFLAFGIFILVMIYALPNYSVKKILRA